MEAAPQDNHFYRRHRMLVDSDVLLAEFAGTADLLVEGLDPQAITRGAPPRGPAFPRAFSSLQQPISVGPTPVCSISFPPVSRPRCAPRPPQRRCRAS